MSQFINLFLLELLKATDKKKKIKFQHKLTTATAFLFWAAKLTSVTAFLFFFYQRQL
jgi:hypothetical protein